MGSFSVTPLSVAIGASLASAIISMYGTKEFLGIITSRFAIIFFLVAICDEYYHGIHSYDFNATMWASMWACQAVGDIFKALYDIFSAMPTTSQKIYATFFLVIFLLKYTKTVIGCFTYMMFKQRHISTSPKYKSSEASVIVPTTFADPNKLLECITRIVKSQPSQIFVVTHNKNVLECEKLLAFINRGHIKVLGVAMLNKRVQILTALDHVTADIIVLADDDVFWPSPPTDRTGKPTGPDYLDLLLAIFEDDHVGAGGTRQRVRRKDVPCMWNFLGIGYLERRTWNNATTNAVDGSISTLSGRTAAYRAEILQTKEFRHYFLNDSWRGKPLNSDDDKCLTRYVYKHGWKIGIQFDSRAVLETTVELGPKYLSQCLRWARAHWRGNFTVMETESYWRSLRMLWGTYVIYGGSFLTPTIIWEGIMTMLLWKVVGDSDWFTIIKSFAAFMFFIIASKLVKYVPHFLRYPEDLKFVPLAIGFSYFHGFLNIYAALTMTTTHWGSQDLGGESEAARGMAMAEKEVVISTS